MNKKCVLSIVFVSFAVIARICPCRADTNIKARISQYSNEYGIDSALAYDLARAESSLDPMAEGNIGERGLYQIRRKTWEWLTDMSFDKAYEVEANIKVAMKYLAWIKKNLGKHYTQARLIAAYNMGLKGLRDRNYEVPKTHRNLIYNKYYAKGE